MGEGQRGAVLDHPTAADGDGPGQRGADAPVDPGDLFEQAGDGHVRRERRFEGAGGGAIHHLDIPTGGAAGLVIGADLGLVAGKADAQLPIGAEIDREAGFGFEIGDEGGGGVQAGPFEIGDRRGVEAGLEIARGGMAGPWPMAPASMRVGASPRRANCQPSESPAIPAPMMIMPCLPKRFSG